MMSRRFVVELREAQSHYQAAGQQRAKRVKGAEGRSARSRPKDARAKRVKGAEGRSARSGEPKAALGMEVPG